MASIRIVKSIKRMLFSNHVSWDVIGSVICIVNLKECVGVNGKRFYTY